LGVKPAPRNPAHRGAAARIPLSDGGQCSGRLHQIRLNLSPNLGTFCLTPLSREMGCYRLLTVLKLLVKFYGIVKNATSAFAMRAGNTRNRYGSSN
jgi:hypothetical protein